MASKRLRARVSYEGRTRWVQGYTKKELENAKIDTLLALKEDHIVLDKRTTVRVWSENWLETYKTDISLSWASDIKSYLKNVIYPHIGSRPLYSVKQIHIKNIFNSITDRSESYNHKIYIILNQIFNSAIENELITKNPIGSLKCPEGSGYSKRRALTEEELFYLEKASEVQRGGLFCKIMLHCGCRPQEVATLKWKDIDFDSKYLNIERALKRDNTIGPPKTKAGFRSIPIPDILFSELLSMRGEDEHFICKNTYGQMLRKTSIERLWQEMLKEMNVQMGCDLDHGQIINPKVANDLTLYCLRHTYCTNLEAAGVPINIAKILMGHESIEVTARIYTHTNKKSLEMARDCINNNCLKSCQCANNS